MTVPAATTPPEPRPGGASGVDPWWSADRESMARSASGLEESHRRLMALLVQPPAVQGGAAPVEHARAELLEVPEPADVPPADAAQPVEFPEPLHPPVDLAQDPPAPPNRVNPPPRRRRLRIDLPLTLVLTGIVLLLAALIVQLA